LNRSATRRLSAAVPRLNSLALGRPAAGVVSRVSGVHEQERSRQGRHTDQQSSSHVNLLEHQNS
jgi:hypothetical protein